MFGLSSSKIFFGVHTYISLIIIVIIISAFYRGNKVLDFKIIFLVFSGCRIGKTTTQIFYFYSRFMLFLKNQKEFLHTTVF